MKSPALSPGRTRSLNTGEWRFIEREYSHRECERGACLDSRPTGVRPARTHARRPRLQKERAFSASAIPHLSVKLSITFGTIRGRVGFALSDLLAFGTAGVAVGHIKPDGAIVPVAVANPPFIGARRYYGSDTYWEAGLSSCQCTRRRRSSSAGLGSTQAGHGGAGRAQKDRFFDSFSSSVSGPVPEGQHTARRGLAGGQIAWWCSSVRHPDGITRQWTP